MRIGVKEPVEEERRADRVDRPQDLRETGHRDDRGQFDVAGRLRGVREFVALVRRKRREGRPSQEFHGEHVPRREDLDGFGDDDVEAANRKEALRSSHVLELVPQVGPRARPAH